MQDKTDSVNTGYAGSALAQQKQLTVRECIDQTIDEHNRQISRLVVLRDTTPRLILDMPQRVLAELVYPHCSGPF